MNDKLYKKRLLLTTIDPVPKIGKGGPGAIVDKIHNNLHSFSLDWESDLLSSPNIMSTKHILINPKNKYYNLLMETIKKLFVFKFFSIYYNLYININKAKKIIDYDKIKNADVIHCHDIHAFNAIFSFMKKRHINKPLLLSIHSAGSNISDLLNNYKITKYKFLFKILYNYEMASICNCKQLILGSDAAFKYLIDDYPKLFRIINNKKIILYNGIEQISYNENIFDMRKKINLENCFICISVGRVEEVKGFDLLINAMEELKKGKNIKMIIIGEGSELKNYKQIVKNKQLSKDILFLGRVENVQNFLDISDLYISPVRRAMFDLSLLEAMRAKLPIIASKIGGNVEAVKDSGILVDLDVNAINQSILSVYLDVGYKEQLRTKSYNNFIENFTIKKMCLNAANIYDKEVLNNFV